jgi:opacity protein-like surface antigen
MVAAMKGLALALCVCAAFSVAHAQEPAPIESQKKTNQIRGLYLSGAGGLNWVRRGNASVFLGTGFNATVVNNADYDRGGAASAAVGYGWKSLFRTEIEGSFRRNDLNAISLQPLSANSITGEVQNWAVMANVLNDFPVNGWLSPYLGGGVGYSEVKLDARCTPAAGFCRYDDRKGGFAYQVVAGASVRLAENAQLFADYRYFGVRNVNLDGATLSDRISELKFRNHAVFFGIRVAFGRLFRTNRASTDAAAQQNPSDLQPQAAQGPRD